MNKQLKQFIVFLATSLIMCLVSCADLKQLNSYASTSLNSLKKFEEINYSFNQHCINNCYLYAIRNYEIKEDTNFNCDCRLYRQADSVTQNIYNSIKGYMEGLTNLSNNELTAYNFNSIKKPLTNGSFGDLNIDSTVVKAYSHISTILIKASTDLYRQKKLKEYIESANSSLKVLLIKFQFILQADLESELKWKKDNLYRYYKEILEDRKISDYEKGKATADYYQQLSDINAKQNQILFLAKSVQMIADGHQKLYDYSSNLNSKNLKDQMTQYSSDIKDIISEFNKIRK